jgi:hypothetical protein
MSVGRHMLYRMHEHKWAPPEHPDVTLHQPVGLAAETASALRTVDPPRPVWADIEFVHVGVLHLKCFAAGESHTAVLVQTVWQGRLQQVLVARDKVTRRVLDPRSH